MALPEEARPRRLVLRRIARFYKATALLLLNIVIVLLVLNVLAAVWTSKPRHDCDPGSAWLVDRYGIDRLARAYPDWPPDDLKEFLFETSNWYHVYEPFTGFRPRARSDRFITYSDAGFRPFPGQGPWPPDPKAINVLVFGGSTAMGAGVLDHQTIAAYLQPLLTSGRKAVNVYNFGRSSYFSTQERVLFEQLLLAGHRFHVAVFLDGLNEFYYGAGNPQWTAEFEAIMLEQNRKNETGASAKSLPQAAATFLEAMPLSRWARSLAQSFRQPAAAVGSQDPMGDHPPAPNAEAPALAVIDRWSVNRRLIRAVGQEFGVRALMVWQPVPTYGYDLKYLNVYDGDAVALFGGHMRSATGYALLAQRRQQQPLGDDVLWLGDLQRNCHENLYVDSVHYTPAFAQAIAREIAEALRARSMLDVTD